MLSVIPAGIIERSEEPEKPSSSPPSAEQPAEAPTTLPFLSDQNRPDPKAPLDGPTHQSRQSTEQSNPSEANPLQVQDSTAAPAQREVSHADPHRQPEAVQRDPEVAQQVNFPLEILLAARVSINDLLTTILWICICAVPFLATSARYIMAAVLMVQCKLR